MQEMEALCEQGPPKGFEMSVVLAKHCKKFVYPTPYEFHFSNSPQDPCDRSDQSDRDLAAHFMVINKAGAVLCGPCIPEVFADVPVWYYLDSICKDVENAREDVVNNPVYVILNLCRVYVYMKDGLVLSKEAAGQWGLDNLPGQYRKLIAAVLEYYTEGADFDLDKDLRDSFCKYMLGLILG
jgi:streptomycin 3"-adenylyltransferase